MNSFHLTLRTPTDTILDVEAQSLQVDTETGRMVVLPGHAALTGTILFSKIVVVHGDNTDSYYIKNGILFIGKRQNTVELLCMSCDHVAQLNRASVEEYLKIIKERLKDKQSLGDYQLKFLQREQFALEEQVKVVK